MEIWTPPTTANFPSNNFLSNFKHSGNTVAKVVGGNFAFPSEFPYQLQLKDWEGDHKCGATLITAFLALTAAHCVDEGTSPGDLKVISGQHLAAQIDGFEQSRDVSQIIMHEDYEKPETGDDIALLVLSHDFKLDDKTNVASIPNEIKKFRAFAYTTGWGDVKERGGSAAAALKKAPVPIISLEDCRRLYAIVNRTVTDDVICAGAQGLDACQGDSGGPLTCIGENGGKFVCGIVSWGVGCGRKGLPTVYTDVAKYLDWIQAQIEKLREQNFCPKIPHSRRCALNYHAPSGSVKNPKSMHLCSPQQFQCRVSNKCIPLVFRCDEEHDCGLNDNSDEMGCPPKHLLPSTSTTGPCISPRFECKVTQKCLPSSYICDGDEDCGEDDSSDEENCEPQKGCHSTYFPCRNETTVSKCIPNRFKCDGDDDCGDNSDEVNCSNSTIISTTTEESTTEGEDLNTCNSDEFRCHETKKCIYASFVCDNYFDCGSTDFSDEVNCK